MLNLNVPTVFLVYEVRPYEGGDLVAIFATREAAQAFADAQADDENARNWSSSTDWQVVEQEVLQRFKAEGREVAK